MSRRRDRVAADPEFNPDRPRMPPRVFRPGVPQDFQRLLANPFLALGFLAFWVQGISWSLGRRDLSTFLTVLGTAVLFPLLFQYHCLDCGSTEQLRRWRGHECETVRFRLDANRPRRFRGPSPGKQTVLWIFALIAAAVAAAGF